MPGMTIRLFGRFDVCCDGRPNAGLNARRARELFSYLLLHRDRPQQREVLAGLLWGDASPEQARKYLRQALWQIQTTLHADVDDADALDVDADWIQLKSCAQWQVDVVCLEEASRRCHGVAGGALDNAERQCLEDAARLYRGDLLEGWYQEWCLFERERLQNEFLEVLEKLVSCCEARGDSERGLAHARRMLAIDPAREQVHRHIMQMHFLAGNRTEALRAFRRCEQVLMQEFGVRPSARTCALHASICEERIDASLPGAAPAEQPRPASTDASSSPIRESSIDPLPALAELIERAQLLFARIDERLREGQPPTQRLER